MGTSSMTGFGRGEAAGGGVKAEVELGTVNRRQFDMHVSLPRNLAVIEPHIRECVHRKISRGHVTGAVRVTVADACRAGTVTLNEALLAGIVHRARAAARRLNVSAELDVGTLLRLPDVIRCEDGSDAVDTVWPVIEKALNRALRELVAMRRKEGERLAGDLAARFKGLQRRAASLRRLAPGVPLRYRKAMEKRLKAQGLDMAAGGEALARELALFADRADISEELVRIESHLAEAASLLSAAKPVGRTLDFLCQELFRETNTIGSKANDLRISRQVVHFKTELESIREQVQNIE
jgi:uncharacterized protein (TIGR00255 family)